MRKLTLTLAAVVATLAFGLGAGPAGAAGFGLVAAGNPNCIDFRGGGVLVDGDRVSLVPSHFEIRPVTERNPVHW